MSSLADLPEPQVDSSTEAGRAGAARIRRRVAVPRWQAPGDVVPELVTFNGLLDAREHIALVWEPVREPPLVRIHSECLTGDVLGSARCDCGPQLDDALSTLAATGGILLYLRQEGRDIGLYRKIDAYSLQDEGLDTVDANLQLALPVDARRYDMAAQMLGVLGHRAVRLITNNPAKIAGLEQAGVRVVEQVPTRVFVNVDNHDYLAAKRSRMGHRIPIGALKPFEGRT